MKKAYSYSRFSARSQKEGDSKERQLKLATEYHARHLKHLQLDTSRSDEGFSAYRGRHVSKGSLGHFLAEIKAGTIEPGSILIVENLDRISRQGPKIARKLLEQIVDNGVDIHVVNLSKVLKYGWEDRIEDSVVVDCELNRAFQESRNRSERCGSAWSKKRHNARGESAMSAKVPKWLKAVKGKPIEVIPERAAIVKQIYDWATQGIGQYAITDKLIKAKVPPWGPKRKGRPPQWNPAYVRDILASRTVIGEYQPMTKTWQEGRQKRVPDGPLVPDYYPQIIPLSLWTKVQDSRRAFANAKFGEALHAGRNKFSTKNLFRNLVWDTLNNAPMVFRNYDGHPCLVTTWREHLRSHKISYSLFEDAMLRFLSRADWKSLSEEGLSPETQELTFRREASAKELDDALKIRSRYESLLDDPEAATDDRINDKYKAAAVRVKRLQEARNALEAEISASRSESETIAGTKGIEFVRADRHSVEGRTKLRLFLSQRIERIDLTFKVEFLMAPDPNCMIAGIRPGKGQTIARVKFKNGTEKMAVFDGKKATLHELGAFKPV